MPRVTAAVAAMCAAGHCEGIRPLGANTVALSANTVALGACSAKRWPATPCRTQRRRMRSGLHEYLLRLVGGYSESHFHICAGHSL